MEGVGSRSDRSVFKPKFQKIVRLSPSSSWDNDISRQGSGKHVDSREEHFSWNVVYIY